MSYIVVWRDGSATENLSYEESMSLIEGRPNDWASVRSPDYGKDMKEENRKLREQINRGMKNGFSTT
jgi:hypothetical protein